MDCYREQANGKYECTVCGSVLAKTSRRKHLLTKKHTSKVQVKEDLQVKEEVQVKEEKIPEMSTYWDYLPTEIQSHIIGYKTHYEWYDKALVAINNVKDLIEEDLGHISDVEDAILYYKHYLLTILNSTFDNEQFVGCPDRIVNWSTVQLIKYNNEILSGCIVKEYLTEMLDATDLETQEDVLAYLRAYIQYFDTKLRPLPDFGCNYWPKLKQKLQNMKLEFN